MLTHSAGIRPVEGSRSSVPSSPEMALKMPAKHVRFLAIDQIHIIDKILPEDKPNVYGSLRQTQYIDESICEEINHVKLYMEVHQKSRQNTKFYKVRSDIMCCVYECCNHKDLLQ